MTDNSSDFNNGAARKNALVSYSDAPADVKAKMDKLMEAADIDPSRPLNFGDAVLQRMERFARELSRVERNVMRVSDDFTQLTDEMKAIVPKLDDAAKDPLGFGDGNFTSLISSQVEIVEKVNKADRAYRDVAKKLEQLGIERLEISRELRLHIGAAPELTRRYDEIYIPEAESQYKESQQPDHKSYLDDVQTRRDDIAERAANLGARNQEGLTIAQQIHQQLESLFNLRDSTMKYMKDSADVWKSAIAKAKGRMPLILLRDPDMPGALKNPSSPLTT